MSAPSGTIRLFGWECGSTPETVRAFPSPVPLHNMFCVSRRQGNERVHEKVCGEANRRQLLEVESTTRDVVELDKSAYQFWSCNVWEAYVDDLINRAW